MNEWIIVGLVAVVVLFGAKKLPELANAMGKSIKEFRKAADEADQENGEESSSTPRDSQADS